MTEANDAKQPNDEGSVSSHCSAAMSIALTMITGNQPVGDIEDVETIVVLVVAQETASRNHAAVRAVRQRVR